MYQRAGFRARIGFVCAPKSARQYSKGINVFWGNGFPTTCELKPRLCDQTGLWAAVC